ncbi:MAG: ABC transporter ATP-binding protein [Gemmatimonadota bacterium]
MNVIETDGLTKRYGELTAVDAISFRVEPGQVFGFLGPNGSGKTTTIGMLLGIIRPTAGTIRLFGRTDRAGLHAARRRIGATLENPNFYPYLSGRDNLRIVANVKGVGRPEIDEALELVGLAGRQTDRYKTYSLGMKQRLAIAATVLGDPELIILDEPTNGLDPEGMREIRGLIRLLADRGKTIFLSSHLLFEVERVCTHVAVIKEGRILRRASVEEFTSGGVTVGVRGGGLQSLRAALDAYPAATSSAIREDMVVAELRDDDLSGLNRYLAERGIYVSHLALRRRSLEDAFLELTGAEAPASPLEGAS